MVLRRSSASWCCAAAASRSPSAASRLCSATVRCRSAAARLSSAPCRCFAVLMGLPPTDAAQMEERTLHGAHDPTPTGPGATPACLPLWTRTSRTPTPLPLQPHPLHHVFGEFLY